MEVLMNKAGYPAELHEERLFHRFITTSSSICASISIRERRSGVEAQVQTAVEFVSEEIGQSENKT